MESLVSPLIGSKFIYLIENNIFYTMMKLNLIF